MDQGSSAPRRKRPRRKRELMGWSLQDIELELGAPVVDAERIMAVHDIRHRVDAASARLQALAAEVDKMDAAAQEAIIERGADPRSFDLDPGSA